MYFRSLCGTDLPPLGRYATGLIFIDQDKVKAEAVEKHFTTLVEESGMKVVFIMNFSLYVGFPTF